MSSFYIGARGYYAGDRIDPEDDEVSERPSLQHELIDGSWVLTMDISRDAKWERIKEARDASEFGTFEYDGMVFDGDAVAKSRLEGACLFVVVLQMQGLPFQTDWTLHDNTVVSLTGEQLINAAIARASHVDAVFARGRELRDLIFASTTTLEDLTGIEWTE